MKTIMLQTFIKVCQYILNRYLSNVDISIKIKLFFSVEYNLKCLQLINNLPNIYLLIYHGAKNYCNILNLIVLFLYYSNKLQKLY